MIRVKKIAHATYEMPDLEKQIEYYTEILGLTRDRQGQGRGLSRLAPSIITRWCCARARRRNACASASRSAPDDDLDAFEKQVQGARRQDRAQEGTRADRSPTW